MREQKMKYYKDTQGNVYAVSPIQTPKEDWVKLTKKETEAHLNPVPTTEQLAATARADRPFPGSEEVDYDVVRGWDGKLYKAGTEPVEPESTPVDIAPVIITSDNITIADAELLMDAANAGEKTAIWLINKLEL